MNKLALTLLLITLFLNCKSSKKSVEPSSRGSQAEKSEILYNITPNESGDYILYTQQQDNASTSRVTFYVIDATSKQKLIEKSIRPGYVKWIDRHTIEFLDVPGMVAANEDLSIYIKKININELKR